MAFFDVSDDAHVQARLEEFLESQRLHKPFMVDLVDDIKLYQVALDLRQEELVKLFVRKLAGQPFGAIVQFVNRVYLLPYDDDLDKPMMNFLARTLEFATTSDLKSFPINPDLSERHQHLCYHQLGLLNCRREMVPLDDMYSAPHVMVSLYEDPEGYPAKYFNGNLWCRLQTNEFLEEYLSCLNLHQFVVVGEKLVFVYEKRNLCVMHLFHNWPVTKIPLKMSVPQDAQLCSDGENLVLLSKDMNMAEIVPEVNGVSYRVSEWRKLGPSEYRIVQEDVYCKILEVKIREEPKTLTVCFQKTYDRLMKLKGENVCTYTIDEHKLYSQTCGVRKRCLFELREDNRGDCQYVLVDREVLEKFLERLSQKPEASSLKRKLDKPKRRYSETRPIKRCVDEKLETMDFSKASIF